MGRRILENVIAEGVSLVVQKKGRSAAIDSARVLIDGRIGDLLCPRHRHPFCTAADGKARAVLEQPGGGIDHPDQLIRAYVRDAQDLTVSCVQFRSDVTQQICVNGVEVPHNATTISPDVAGFLVCPNKEPDPDYWLVFRPYSVRLGGGPISTLDIPSYVNTMHCVGYKNTNIQSGNSSPAVNLHTLSPEALLTKAEIRASSYSTGLYLDGWYGRRALIKVSSGRHLPEDGMYFIVYSSSATWPKPEFTDSKSFEGAVMVPEHYFIAKGVIQHDGEGCWFVPNNFNEAMTGELAYQLDQVRRV